MKNARGFVKGFVSLQLQRDIKGLGLYRLQRQHPPSICYCRLQKHVLAWYSSLLPKEEQNLPSTCSNCNSLLIRDDDIAAPSITDTSKLFSL